MGILLLFTEIKSRFEQIDRRRKQQLFESDSDDTHSDSPDANQASPVVNRTFERSLPRRRNKLRYSSFSGMDHSDGEQPEKPGDISGDTLTSSTRSLRSRKSKLSVTSGFNLSESDEDDNSRLVIDEETKTLERNAITDGELTKTLEKYVDERTKMIRKKTPKSKKSFAMQFDLTNKSPASKSFGMQFNIDNKTCTQMPTPGKTTTSSFDLSDTAERISEDQLITLTLPSTSPEKSRNIPPKKPSSNDETDKMMSTSVQSAGSERNNETEINFKPRPKLSKPKKRKNKTVVHQTEAFTVADPVNLVEAAGDEHEDFAFDLIAMFETEAFAIPSKWSAKPKFIKATNHIQQCLATELQKRAEDLLEARVAKGPPVTMGKIRGLIGEFDKVKTIKQYAKRLSRLDKAHDGSDLSKHQAQLKDQLKQKLDEKHS